MLVTDSLSPVPLTFPLRIPLWLWLLAFAGGIALAVGSLNYAPTGRLNILWLWLLWAGLPLAGSVVSLLFLLFGRGQPWLFRWRQHRLHWHPSPRERRRMLLSVQQLWLMAGFGLLLAYLVLLLFTDLAFGWSSTLIDQSEQVRHMIQILAAPWSGWWPSAVPGPEVIEATRYVRINPTAGGTQQAGDWWQFLLASLLIYNLLPRLLIATVIALDLRWRGQHQLRVRAPVLTSSPVLTSGVAPAMNSAEDLLANWQSVPVLHWELGAQPASQPGSASLQLGLADWHKDEQAMKHFLQTPPQKLRWQVNALRSPVAELADLIDLARLAGVQQQALYAVAASATVPERHSASWRAFASKQQLVWLEE
jgi:hypothetical protein